jgi:Transposase zinc-ribbon domain
VTAARPLRSGPRAGAGYPSSLSQFLDWFDSDADCAAYLARLRWHDGFSCPSCGPGDAWLTKRHLYDGAGFRRAALRRRPRLVAKVAGMEEYGGRDFYC